MTFVLGTDPEKAKQFFTRKFGYTPETAEVYKRLLWVGPVREVEND